MLLSAICSVVQSVGVFAGISGGSSLFMVGPLECWLVHMLLGWHTGRLVQPEKGKWLLLPYMQQPCICRLLSAVAWWHAALLLQPCTYTQPSCHVTCSCQVYLSLACIQSCFLITSAGQHVHTRLGARRVAQVVHSAAMGGTDCKSTAVLVCCQGALSS